MSHGSIGLSAKLSTYLIAHGVREDADLAALRKATAPHPWSVMQISPEQGQFLALLVQLIGATRTLEIGTFTGYSAMWVAKAMGPKGRIVALDVSEEFTAPARKAWAKAGIAKRIDLRIAPALETLKKMKAAGEKDFDFAFIDADKPNYDGYYEYALKLVRKNGLIAIDNVLWRGAVADPKDKDENTVALRALNAKIAKDKRVDVCMVPIGDGLTLARKI